MYIYLASDKGYSSMSQEDIHRDSAAPAVRISSSNTTAARNTNNDISQVENEAFRAKVGSIIKRSMGNLHEAGGHNMTGSYCKYYNVVSIKFFFGTHM